MRLRWGLGPVFAFESLTAARRWQTYALRSLYVALLLTGLTFTWGPSDRTINSLAEASEVGSVFLNTVIVAQLLVVLFAAPAATAGAVCVDKARGTLHHAFVTALSDREIVLGKLGARLAPVLSLLAIGLPVLSIGSFLGGIELEAAIGAELVTAGTAVLCCSLSLLTSIWARKPHQALLLSYSVIGLWVGFLPALNLVIPTIRPPASLLEAVLFFSNPFSALVAPIYWRDDPLAFLAQVVYLLTALLFSSLLIGLACSRLRPTVLAQSDRPQERKQPDAPARLVDYLPEPPLDGNPVLWREWHRKRPSRWTGRFWTAYAVASTLASLYVLANYYLWGYNLHNGGGELTAAAVNACEVSIGLLLLSVSAATALAEERDRGSLDVILTTPLTTREIVWGKWWGVFAMVPRLAILPIWVAAGTAMITGGFPGLLLMTGLILAYAAAITSFGLAVATWIPRLGRVITACVVSYIVLSLGWPLLIELSRFQPALYLGQGPLDHDGLYLASPFFGIHATTLWAARVPFSSQVYNYDHDVTHGSPKWPLIWIGVYSLIALLLVLKTIATFDRCMGRMRESRREPRPAGVPPRPSRKGPNA